jgi:hypothetical protein
VERECPSCRREYDAELNFCPKCGEPSKVSQKNFAKEPADQHEATGGSFASNVTSHMDGFFPSNPHRVEPLPDAEGGARTVESSHHQETVKAPAPATTLCADAKPGLPPSPKPLADNSAYYRSVRTLSIAIVVGHGLTTLGVISLALILTLSQQRLWNTTQERQVALTEKVMTTNETLLAKLEQANAEKERSNASLEKSDTEKGQLKQVNAKLEQANAKLEQANAANEDSLRRTKDQVTEQRIAAMPAKLTRKVTSTVASNLTSLSAKVKGRNAKRGIEALKQSVLDKEDRVAIFKDYVQLLPKLDEQTRADIEDKVLKPLMGE